MCSPSIEPSKCKEQADMKYTLAVLVQLVYRKHHFDLATLPVWSSLQRFLQIQNVRHHAAMCTSTLWFIAAYAFA